MSKRADAQSKVHGELAMLRADVQTLIQKNQQANTQTTYRIHIKESDLEELWIRKKDGTYCRMKLKPAQKIILSDINGMLAAGIPPRLTIEKARRLGNSTLLCGIAYITMREYNYRWIIIGHQKTASIALFNIIKLMYKRDRRKIASESNTKFELAFDEGGRVWVATAGKDEIGRADTNQGIIFTEYGLCPGDQASEVMAAAGETVDLAPNTFIIIESTGKGFESDFHRLCTECEAGVDEEGNPAQYQFRFLGWGQDPEYTCEIATEVERHELRESLDADELELLNMGYSLNQLKWRRKKITSMRGKDRDAKIKKFKQEYPSTWQEAFLGKTGAIFDQNVLVDWKNEADVKPSIFRGSVDPLAKVIWAAFNEKILAETMSGAFHQDSHEYMEIREWPEQYVDYCMGVDVSEGLGNEEIKHDESAILIARCDTGDVVCVWKKKVKPYVLAEYMYALGLFYNEAFICQEINNMGHEAMRELVKLKYPEHRIYHKRTGSNIAHEDLVEQLGFATQGQSKKDLFAKAIKYISNRKIKILHRDTIAELSNIKDEKGDGKPKTNGKDLLMAALLLIEALDTAFPYKAPLKPKLDDPNNYYQNALREIKEENNLAARQRATGLDALKNRTVPDSFQIAC